MALGSAAGVPISRRMVSFDIVKSERGQLILWTALLTLLVAGPWLLPGYVFGTDWPGPRRIDWPTGLYSSAPLQAALAGISWALGGETAGKLLVVGSLFAASAAAYGAVPVGGFVPRATASAVYLLNPFVYGRMHYGQLYLIAAYAVLPWAALGFRNLFLRPGARSALLSAAAMGLLGMLDLHVFLMAAVLAVSLLAGQIAFATGRLAFVRRLAPYGLLALLTTVVISAYWTVPLLLGRGPEGARLAGIGPENIIVFAAVPDDHLGLLPNLLGLYGFWAEDSGRFASMKLFVPFWPVVLVLLLSVGAIGAVAAFRSRQDRVADWVAGLLLAGAIGLVLEMGVSHPWTSSLVMWLDSHLSVYRGMRDAGKWAALLAFVYSQLVALGTATILDWLKRRSPAARKTEWLTSTATGVLIALPLYYGNGLLFGMHGEIKPSSYPAGWYQADRVLAADRHPGRTLFLPWHEYMAYSFVQNQNKVVAAPAPSFFSVPMIVSTNPEVPGTPVATDPDHLVITTLLRQSRQGEWAVVLASLDIKYILVAHEADWGSYQFLDDQPRLVKIGDFGSILLYRNEAVRGP